MYQLQLPLSTVPYGKGIRCLKTCSDIFQVQECLVGPRCCIPLLGCKDNFQRVGGAQLDSLTQGFAWRNPKVAS